MSASYYPVYKLRFFLAMADPDMPEPRYHTTIFVETDQADQSGFLHHVTGDITSTHGMRYERKPRSRPEESRTFYNKELLGYTPANDYPTSFDNILSNVPAPPRQKAFNIATMRTEPFKTPNPLTFYKQGEARQPLVKCTEWTNDRAIPALQSTGLIVTQIPASTRTDYSVQTTTTGASSSGQVSESTQAASSQAAGNNGWVWDESVRRYRYWNSVTQQWIWAPTAGQ
jgi:hypothetical protein